MDHITLASQKISSIFESMDRQTLGNSTAVGEWDAKSILDNLSFLEDKIHHLKTMIHQISAIQSQPQPHSPGNSNEMLSQRQQLVLTDLTSIIIQLMSHSGSLLPLLPSPCKEPVNPNSDEECEDLETASYEIRQLEEDEIMALHAHFCSICGKGFRRAANLRMHMRGHGDEYKTIAALAKPKEPECEGKVKRYSCPFRGCKRNKDHEKFQPLKTILCVKNHYKRSHCDKSFTCGICNTKKFSVLADLKTHEKHCGKEKWLCSCGTSFSRKDKLFGHVALFHGHSPAIVDDSLSWEWNKSRIEMGPRICEFSNFEADVFYNR